MNKRTQGTLVLDGLIEGTLPPTEAPQGALRGWVSFAERLGLRLSLEIEGNRFSILPDNQALPADRLGPEPARTIADALEQLLKLYDQPDPQVFSTLRSEEYRPGEAVQTLYAFQPDGTVAWEQRTVEMQTAPRPEPVSWRQHLRRGAVAGGIVLAALLVSALFIDYGELLASARRSMWRPSAEQIDVAAPAFEPYFSIEDKRIERISGRDVLVLKLARTGAFPRDAAALDRAAARAPLTRRLALEALARGYVRLELFDPDGKYLGSSEARIRPLRDQPTLEVAVPLPTRSAVGRIEMIY